MIWQLAQASDYTEEEIVQLYVAKSISEVVHQVRTLGYVAE